MNDQQENDQLLSDHAYDGIQEYDNPMPGWWKWIFAGTVGFAVVYFFVAIVSDGQMSAVAAYDRDVVAELKKTGVLNRDAATLLRLSKDPDFQKTGAAIFATNCIACHGKDGQGVIGPNLTDDFYLNVEKIEDIVDVVTKGRKNGAMPAWENRLSPNDIVTVASYAASLRGKNLAGKPHEGKQIPPWNDGH